MHAERRINQIIENNLAALSRDEVSLDSILQQYPDLADELRPRLEAAVWMFSAKNQFATRPGFILDSRKYLETKIVSLPHHGRLWRFVNRYTPQRWAFNVTSAVVIVLLMVTIVNSLVLSARLAIPGDPLYSTKLALEDIRLALTFNRLNKTDLYMQYSHERTLEFVDLVLEGDYQYLPSAAARMETEIIDTLHSLNKIPSQDLAMEQPLDANLRQSLSNEIFMLSVLRTSAPPSAYPGIELAVQAAQSGLIALR